MNAMAGSPIFIGLDVGTQGVRAMAVGGNGDVVASHQVRFGLEGTREEQSPEEWWSSLVGCLLWTTAALKDAGLLHRVTALSVTSTSGTLIALDDRHMPVSQALMYSDKRSAAEAELCVQAAAREPETAYKAYNASSGLPKIVWFMRTRPEAARRIRLWVHAADFIIGRLSGVWGVTDYTSCMKTGYDLELNRWPDYISGTLGVPSGWLPEVVAPGTPVGRVTPEAAELTGLPRDTLVVTGMTDGCTSQVASGALAPGDWNTTIGTTLVVKGVTRSRLADPLGRLYNHRHPEGWWMPGGASNTGGDWVSRDYAGADLQRLNAAAAAFTPTRWLSYPLLQEGERFPFVSAAARGFDEPGLTPEQRFAARLEGVAFMERLSYELIESLSGESVSNVYTAGGASNSDVWLQIRSSVLNRPIRKARHVEGAVGAAVLAASQTHFAGLSEAGARMIQLERTVEPGSREAVERYEEQYARFVQKLRDNHYITA